MTTSRRANRSTIMKGWLSSSCAQNAGHATVTKTSYATFATFEQAHRPRGMIVISHKSPMMTYRRTKKIFHARSGELLYWSIPVNGTPKSIFATIWRTSEKVRLSRSEPDTIVPKSATVTLSRNRTSATEFIGAVTSHTQQSPTALKKTQMLI